MHISLDSALGRQRRLNSVGESVLQIAPNAAAAYSLRSLTGGDPKVVRVRRGSDNHEQDFTASEVSSGALTSFVNAQVVAPLDIQALSATGRDGDFLIAKAAYSLRSLGTRQATLAATGDTVARADGKFVVQVRRSSDDAVKSFTADEVTDGTLLAFVNEIQTLGTAVNGTGSFDNYTVSNLSNTGFSADNSAGGTGSAGFPYVFKDEDVIVVKYTVTNFSSTASLSPQVRGVSAINSVAGKTNSGTAFTANGTYTDTLTATADGTHLMFADGNTGSYTISDFEIVSHSSNGFVKTWYDQSVTNQAGDTATGNHAVQATAANQPKIVNAGALVTGGLDFDGTAHQLTLSSTLGITSAASHFAVINPSGGGADTLFDNRDSSVDGYRIATSSTTKINFDWLNSDVEIDRVSGQAVYYFNKTSSQTQSGANGGTLVTASESGSVSVTTAPRIGARSFSSALNFFAGTINEFIIYDTDQTDNRTAIEANIGEAYSIDLPSGVDPGFDQVDGFVETWYDQSGNGNDVTQATAASQPKIVSAGTLVTATNSLPAIDFTSSSTKLARAEFLTGQLNSFFNTYQAEAGDSTQAQVVVRQGANYRLANQVETNGKIRSQIRDSGGSSEIVEAGGDLATGSPLLHTTLIGARGSNGITIFVNGANEVSGDTADIEDTNFATADIGDFAIGAIYNSASYDFHGKGQEFIFYNSDQSANRVAVETNINSHYSIF